MSFRIPPLDPRSGGDIVAQCPHPSTSRDDRTGFHVGLQQLERTLPLAPPAPLPTSHLPPLRSKLWARCTSRIPCRRVAEPISALQRRCTALARNLSLFPEYES